MKARDDHKDRPNHMLQHMLKRGKLRRDKGVASRFELGTAAALKKLEAGWQDYRKRCPDPT